MSFLDLFSREGLSGALTLPGVGAATSDNPDEAFTGPLNLFGEGDPASIASQEMGLRTPAEATDDVSGQTAANAVLEGQRLQEEFGREALGVQDAAQRRLEETLSPFVNFGQGLIGNQQALFGGNTMQNAAGSQNITDLTSLADQMIMDNPAINPNAQSLLAESSLLNAPQMLSRERGDLLSALGIGQASAAQQGAAGLQTGGNAMDLLSQIGNVQAAGGIGQANALGQGGNNIAGLGAMIGQRFGGQS